MLLGGSTEAAENTSILSYKSKQYDWLKIQNLHLLFSKTLPWCT